MSGGRSCRATRHCIGVNRWREGRAVLAHPLTSDPLQLCQCPAGCPMSCPLPRIGDLNATHEHKKTPPERGLS